MERAHAPGERESPPSVGLQLSGVGQSHEHPTATGKTSRDGKLERQEHAADVERMRRVLLVAVPIWFACSLLDWAVVELDLPGELPHLLLLRLLEGVIAGGALVRLFRHPPPTPRVLRALDVAVFMGASIAITLIGVRDHGIASPYGPAVACVLVARGIALPDEWRRGSVLLGLALLAYPITLVVAGLFDHRLVDQLDDKHAVATLITTLAVQLTAYAILVAGGHAVWQLRRQVFEAKIVGRYRLRRLVGRGGMGDVWVAYHPALKRDVAVKILRTSEASDANIARFEREVRATSELVHPNTVRILDFGTTDDGLWFYAMELLEGETLTALVDRERGLPAARAVYIVAQAARALAEAHRRGIVHRDVKPENLFLTSLGGEHDFVKVLDFGIAKIAATEAPTMSLTREGAVLGTPLYMAPEQGAGEAVDARSDVYALGAVLYFALTGKPPFEGGSAAATLVAHLRDPVVPPSLRAARDVPSDVEAVVLRCLEKEPAARFASAAELADALAACSVARAWTPSAPLPRANEPRGPSADVATVSLAPPPRGGPGDIA